MPPWQPKQQIAVLACLPQGRMSLRLVPARSSPWPWSVAARTAAPAGGPTGSSVGEAGREFAVAWDQPFLLGRTGGDARGAQEPSARDITSAIFTGPIRAMVRCRNGAYLICLQPNFRNA